MKKLFLFLAFFGCIAFSVNAQKACCASKSGVKTSSKTAAKSCGSAKTAAADTKAAVKLASMTDGIESKVCSTSGTVSYVKNYICPETGKMTSASVKYDAATQKFVNVSPKKSCSSSKASCSKTAAKSCGSAKSASAANTKAAAKLASMTDEIESKVCSTSGTVSYVKNYICSESGKMTSTPVEYDAATQKFVNVSPQNAEQGVGGQNADVEVKAVKTAKTIKTTKKKSCCASKAGKSSCSKEAKKEN